MPNDGTILLAEDSADDVLLLRMAFKRAGFSNPIHVVTDGEKAIQYLKGEGIFSDRDRYPVPQILLLDLKMPRMNGFDVLSWLRQRPEWKCLPVIVITTSFYGPDIEQAYEAGANSFLTKPAQFDEFVATVKQMGTFWLGHTILPAPGPFIPPPTPEKPRREILAKSERRLVGSVRRSTKAKTKTRSRKAR